MSRMMHVTLQFNATAWAAWARRNGVDERGIEFVLTYPEVVTGGRTTPRSLLNSVTRSRISRTASPTAHVQSSRA